MTPSHDKSRAEELRALEVKFAPPPPPAIGLLTREQQMLLQVPDGFVLDATDRAMIAVADGMVAAGAAVRVASQHPLDFIYELTNQGRAISTLLHDFRALAEQQP
jgi:hypothetical protein